MINNFAAPKRRLVFVMLAASTAFALPLQAKDQPSSSGEPNKASQPHSAEHVLAIPVPLPLPGQLKQLPQASAPPRSLGAAGRSHPSQRPPAPRDRVGAANSAARIEPYEQGFVNAIQQYPYAEGALYQVYAKPGQVTDIALQEGEQLVGSGPVASGDTVRWMIGDTISGTDNPSVYMASVSWTYPQDELIALRQARTEAERIAPVATGMDLSRLNFRYEIDGDKAEWRPLRAFDDGVRVFIEFPESVAQGELPPLFVIGSKGEAELVNYRFSGRYMIVDRLFARAELRLGARKGQKKVRITANRRVRK